MFCFSPAISDTTVCKVLGLSAEKSLIHLLLNDFDGLTECSGDYQHMDYQHMDYQHMPMGTFYCIKNVFEF